MFKFLKCYLSFLFFKDFLNFSISLKITDQLTFLMNSHESTKKSKVKIFFFRENV